MNKKNFIKGTALPVTLFLSALTLSPVAGVQPVSAAVQAVQQQGVIQGTVTDNQGEPIIGASVVIDGTTNGTITDIDGVFRISAKPGDKLKISFIGYVAQTVTAKNNMRVVLVDDTQMLQEVEVVAYGTQKKVTMTGAIASVRSEDLTRTSVGSVGNVLGGQMTGLTTVQYSGEPGEDAAEIFIRGKATFNDATPLVQVDGVERSMNDIDPNEIETISILKDASATAVFGVRGANGVILITTKRGQEGKAKISFNTSASILTPTKMVETASSYDYATFYNQMCRNDGLTEAFSNQVLELFRTGADPIRFPSVNWIDYLMKDMTLQTQHNLSISGGTDRVRYFISASAYTQGGLFEEFDLPYHLDYRYVRYNYRSNLDIDVTKSTTLSVNIAGNIDNSYKPYTSQGTSGMIRNIYYSTPFYSPGFVNGNLVYNTTTVYNDGLSLPFVGDVDPLTYYGGGFTSTNNNKLNFDLILNQKLDMITKGLSFHIKGSYNSSYTVYKYGTGGTNMSYNPYLQDDGTVGLRPVDGSKDTDISYSYGTGRARDWYAEAGFDYSRTFGDHTVGALVLYNQSKEYYYGDEYDEIPHAYVGLVGRVTYDWKNRYMAEFNIGYNGSENFAPGKRFAPFPAGSVGWNVSEEKFFEPLKPIVSFLKLRVSVGLVGSDTGGSRFLYLADPYYVNLSNLANRVTADSEGSYGYNFGVDNTSVSYGAREYAKNNADVSWEKALKRNYGIDANFFNDRLRTTFEYYREHRWDILVQDATAPGMLGFTVPYANLGVVDSWGWELSLKWNDQLNKNFRYWLGLNLSYNQNKIVEMKETPQSYSYQYQTGNRIGSRLQYVFWRYYDEDTPALYESTFNRPFPSYEGVTIQNGDVVFLDLNGDRVIDSNDMSYGYGYTDDPEYMAGINLGFSWKNWEVNTQWTAAWNVSRMISDVFRQPFLSSAGTQYGGLLAYHLENTWTEDNPSQDALYPRATWANATYNYATSTLYEKDAKYLRLKTLQIAYNFDMPWMKKLGLTTFQLAFSGYNLLTFTPYIFGDPEARATNAPSYPLNRTYTLSLKLGF